MFKKALISFGAGLFLTMLWIFMAVVIFTYNYHGLNKYELWFCLGCIAFGFIDGIDIFRRYLFD